MAKCACGRTMSKFSRECKSCHKKSQADAALAYIVAEKIGTCPHHPEHSLAFNNSLSTSMWLQCLYPHATASEAIAATHTNPGGERCHYQVLCGREQYRALKGALA